MFIFLDEIIQQYFFNVLWEYLVNFEMHLMGVEYSNYFKRLSNQCFLLFKAFSKSIEMI